MARIRSIKPEIRRSLIVSSWPYPIRWTFVGLLGYLDDSGRGHDDTRLIKAELYPLDDDMTARKLEQHLIAISTNGPLCRYKVNGQTYLHITTWAEHQRVNRPTPSRIPPCPIHETDVRNHGATHDGLTEGSSPRAQARVPAEQGREQGAGSREPVSREARRPSHGVNPPTAKGSTDHPGVTHPARVLPLLDQTGPWVAAIRGQLAIQVDALVDEGLSDQVITAALDDWRTESANGGAGPGLLPHLAQRRLGSASTTGSRSRPGPKSRAAQTLELAERLEQAQRSTG